jgi:hypothetical protein
MSEANARDAEIMRGEALADWFGRIAAGETERSAAIAVQRVHGTTYKQLRGWCDRDEEWGEMLAQAHARKVERMESVLRRIATSDPGDITEDPGSARVKASTAQWLLSKWDRKTYGDAKTVETTGKDGGPVQQELTISIADANALAKDDET